MTHEALRQQAWDFFELQAEQRLTTFNFYIALSSLLSGGLAASFTTEVSLPYLGLLLGFLLVLLSFVFWKLDCRNRDLIKGAEEALRFFEAESPLPDEGSRPHPAKRFSREAFDTAQCTATISWRVWRNHYTYSWCFRVVFVTFGIVGVLGGALSVIE